MRRLAIAGAAHLSNGLVATRLVKSSFAQNYTSLIEVDDRVINRTLTFQYIRQFGGGSSKFYVTPFRKGSEFDIVLFRPHFLATAEVSKIEIVQIGNVPSWSRNSGLPRQYELGFRFESRSESDTHGYPHMQFTETFLGNITLRRSGASIQYPAVPIAEKRPHSRLFAALVSFTGLDCNLRHGLPRYIGALQNTGGTAEEFENFVREARTTCKELSRAWNGRRGFNNGTMWGRAADRLIAT